MDKPEHLIVQTAFLGDLLLASPLLKSIRRLEPNAKITVLCRKGLGDLLLKSGLADEAIEADKKSKASWKAVTTNLANREFDLVICPHESVRSLLLVRRLKARKKIGYASFLSRFVFDERIQRPMHLPEALRQLSLLRSLDSSLNGKLKNFARTQSLPGGQSETGELVPVPEWATMEIEKLTTLKREFRRDPQTLATLASSNKVAELASKLGMSGNKTAFLAPGSVWPTKQWTFRGYVQAAKLLLEQGYSVVLTGSPDEKDLCLRLAREAPGAQVIAGQVSLFESMELMALGHLVVSNDSGSMHMAVTGGVPTVSVFGPTVLDLGYRPWQNQAAVVQVPRSRLSCRPCGKHGSRKCPIGTHECMTRIEAEEVVEAARRVTGDAN